MSIVFLLALEGDLGLEILLPVFSGFSSCQDVQDQADPISGIRTFGSPPITQLVVVQSTGPGGRESFLILSHLPILFMPLISRLND